MSQTEGTLVGGGRLSKAAGDKVAAEPQGLVGPTVDVLHQHVHVGVLAPGGQVQQLIKLLGTEQSGMGGVPTSPETKPKRKQAVYGAGRQVGLREPPGGPFSDQLHASPSGTQERIGTRPRNEPLS